MRRFLAWTSAAIGAAWLLRRLRRRHTPPAPAEDPAEELRRKLAETRPEETPGEAEAQPEPPAAAEAPLDERRRAVHERARAAIDDMKSEPPEPE